MVSEFITLTILSLVMLCFKQTQWLGFLGAAILGMIYPIATSIIGIIAAFCIYWFKHRKK